MNFNYEQIFIAIATKDIQTLTDFYRQVLQKQPTIDRPGIYTEFAIAQLRLAIFKPKAERQSEFANVSSSISLCLEVENLEQAIATFTDLGYPPPGEIIKADHGQEIYAYDPIGNRLILHQPKKS